MSRFAGGSSRGGLEGSNKWTIKELRTSSVTTVLFLKKKTQTRVYNLLSVICLLWFILETWTLLQTTNVSRTRSRVFTTEFLSTRLTYRLRRLRRWTTKSTRGSSTSFFSLRNWHGSGNSSRIFSTFIRVRLRTTMRNSICR